MPNVTVLIASYNRSKFIIESLESILNQTKPPKQIIIINDGSTDDTKKVLEHYLNKIIYLEKENGGKSTALNYALPYITGEYVWIFDDDDVAMPNALERHLQVLETDQTIDFTYSTYCRGTTGDDFKIIPGPDVKAPNIASNEAFIKMLENCFMIQQSMLVRRNAFLDVAPYDAELIRSQDYDFLLRLNKKYRGAMIEGPTFYRRYHSGTRGSNNDIIHTIDIDKKWYEYEKIAIRKQYATLELKDYLNKGCQYSPSVERLALIQRVSVMAVKGLWDHFCFDLNSMIKISSDDFFIPLSKKEISLCQNALTNPLAIIDLLNDKQRYRSFLNCMQSLQLPDLKVELAKGLYHNLLKNKDHYSIEQFVKSSILLLKILGLKTLAKTAIVSISR